MEFICVDDGSEDGSTEIVSKYIEKDSRFILIRQNHNGVSSARNNGLDNASGEYLIFLDSDDELLPGALVTMLEYSQKYRLDALIHGAEVDGPIDAWQRKDLRIEKYHTSHLRFSRIFKTKGFVPFVWSYIFRRECLEYYRFDEKLMVGEDAAFLFRVLSEIKRVRIIENQLLIHHLSPKSTVSMFETNATLNFNEHLKLIESVLSNCTDRQLKVGLGCWLFDQTYWSYNRLSIEDKATYHDKIMNEFDKLDRRYPLKNLDRYRNRLLTNI